MARTFNPNNVVSVGDPTLKTHYDQLLDNGVVAARICGRMIGRSGLDAVWNDVTSWAMMPEGVIFYLPATDDCIGLDIRVTGLMLVESAGQSGSVRLEYWDGVAYVAVANSAVTFNSTTQQFLQSVNIQANLFSAETFYRFTSQMSSAGHRMRGSVFLQVKG